MRFRKIATTLAAAFVLAGCGGSATSSGSAPATAIDKAAFGMGLDSSPDEAYLPMYMALDTMRKEGYNVPQPTQLNGTDLVVQAVANNQLQFMSSGVINVATPISKGLPLKVFSARQNNTWSLVSESTITSCDQLNGKKVALFSTGGTSTAYINIYLAKHCPNAKPNYLVIADSPLRRQALENGQVSAAPLEGGDTITLTNNNPKFHVLVSFAKEMPGVGRDAITTNSDFIKQHPTIVKAFLKAELQAIRSLYKDPNAVIAPTQKYMKYGDQASIVGKFYVQNQAWCANGGLNPQDMQNQLQVFQDAKKIPTSVTLDQLVDDTQMKAVLKEIGTSSATTC